MLYELMAAAVAFVGILLFLLALRALLRGDWFMGWLRGTLGMAVLSLAVLLALAAWDLLGYEEILADKPLATISFAKLDERHFTAVLTFTNDPRERKYELFGDQWQLDARIIKWHDTVRRFGLKPGYRMGRLAGRFYLLEEERNPDNRVHDLDPSFLGIDVWNWFNAIDAQVPWLDAMYGNPAFAPMQDGAMFGISLTPSGLIASPINESARQALQLLR